jgi:putative restriction endonuclease
MRIYVYPTDPNWFRFLSHAPDVDEVNFWQPGGHRAFSGLAPGELLLFRLKSPVNLIAGGGVFVRSSVLPIPLAWEAFGHKNGVASLSDFRTVLGRYKEGGPNRLIGCIALADPVFLPQDQWIPVPKDYHANLVQGKQYNATEGTGRSLLAWAQTVLYGPRPGAVRESVVPPRPDPVPGVMWTEGVIGRRRLGQGAFRVLVSEAYARRCAISGERTVPVLEAAHILPVADGGEHRLTNGMLLRADIHRLFDDGYVGIDERYRVHVSRRLKEDWQNGKIYYQHEDRTLHIPEAIECRPDPQLLQWHMDTRFRR